jgi:uncharacterized UBP type Zn finger protein
MVCEHVREIRPVERRTEGCEECERSGGSWVQLRMCLTCGHVGCCDSSSGQHARKHWHGTGHPVIQSAEPGQGWRWCYPDADYLDPEGASPAP